MPALDRTLEAQLAAERSRAARALLRTPFLTAEQDSFELVRTHAAWLQRFFAEQTGWVLTVDGRRGFARLRKLTDLQDATRGAVSARADARPFNARRYVLLCLAAAALERCGAQTTVQELAERVTDLAAAADDIEAFDPTSQHERRALVDALRQLLSLGVIDEQDSDGDYVTSGSGNVLYNVDARRLAQLIVAPRPPSSGVPVAELLHEDRYGSADDQDADLVALRTRHRLVRRLLDDPVVYFDELDDLERTAFDRDRTAIRKALAEVGFVVEQRAEGWAAIDPDGQSTDVAFPGPDSTVKHAALLLSDHLVERYRRTGDAEVDPAETTAFIAELLDEHPTWAKTYQASRDGAARLTRDALDLLQGLSLVRLCDAAGVQVLPAAARFRATIATAEAEATVSSAPATPA